MSKAWRKRTSAQIFSSNGALSQKKWSIITLEPQKGKPALSTMEAEMAKKLHNQQDNAISRWTQVLIIVVYLIGLQMPLTWQPTRELQWC